MPNSIDTCSQATTKLKVWIKSTYSKNPILKKRATFDERAKFAGVILEQHLGKNKEFTTLMSCFTDISGKDSKGVLLSALRDTIQQMESEYEQASSTNTRKLVTV